MVKQKKLFLTVISCMFMIVISEKTVSQNKEALFENYNLWSITGGLNVFSGSISTPVTTKKAFYKLNKSKVATVGFLYDFLKKKRWNFRTGLHLQQIGDADEEFFAKEETVFSGDVLGSSSSNLELIIYAPLTAEYVFLIRDVNIAVGSGVGLSYFKHNDSSIGKISINNIEILNSQYSGNGNFFTSAHFQIGTYLRRNKFLMGMHIVYKKSFKDFRIGDFV